MRIELVKRQQPSKLFSALSPLLALSLTLIFGGLAFALMGKDPLHALYVFFVEPLLDILAMA
jgi:simple sugar transport system permease protein